MSTRITLAVCVLAILLSGPLALFRAASSSAEEKLPSILTGKISQEAKAGAQLQQLESALRAPGQSKPWKPAVNDEKSRGPGLFVYSKVAPATVVVRTAFGHGTGFIIDPDGWLVTNYHVIEWADIDPKTGAQFATIHFGKLDDDGLMQLLDDEVRALVYKSSAEKDLALLKLLRMPQGFEKLPVVPLAKKSALPGSDCVAVGHPTAGMLWTVRSGEVSGVGQWPGQMIEVVMGRLSATGVERQEFITAIEAAPQRKVLLSTCGLNPGDSGGPLVNKAGELIAVSFAIPQSEFGDTISLDKFSYHIHLDELTKFIADRPQDPPVFAPSPWPAATMGKLHDMDENGRADTLIFGVGIGQSPTGILFDLDEDSDRWLTERELLTPASQQKWDFEFAVQRFLRLRVFYDTDNDGQFDLVLVDQDDDGLADVTLRLENNKWMPGTSNSIYPFNRFYFSDQKLRDQFEKLVMKR